MLEVILRITFDGEGQRLSEETVYYKHALRNALLRLSALRVPDPRSDRGSIYGDSFSPGQGLGVWPIRQCFQETICGHDDQYDHSVLVLMETSWQIFSMESPIQE